MELETFREETRDWLETNCPQEMRLGAIHFEDAYEVYRTDAAIEWRDRAVSPCRRPPLPIPPQHPPIGFGCVRN